jgi:hypothetical protein
MRIIDFHTHIFPDHLAERAMKTLSETSGNMPHFHDGTKSGLLASMDAAGIDQSVLLPVATRPEQVRSINASCADLFSKRTVPFGTLHPRAEDPEAEILFLKSLDVKGIKLHPEYQDFQVDEPRYFPMYEQLSAAGLIVVFHAGHDPGPFEHSDHALPPALKKVHERFPRLCMVAAHMGGWRVWEEVESLLAGTDIRFDTSAVQGELPDAAFLRLLRKHGVERVLFGTDSPWFDQSAMVRWIDALPLTTGEKERLFFRNAEEVLHA